MGEKNFFPVFGVFVTKDALLGINFVKIR